MEPADVQIAQFIAYVTLTLTSILVTSAALFWTYRNNFGWKPVAFVSMQTFMLEQEGQHNGALKLEIWNRSKLPIDIRSIDVRFACLQLVGGAVFGQGKIPYVVHNENRLFRQESEALGPTSHVIQDIPFTYKSTGTIFRKSPVTITVCYYDPRRDRIMSATHKTVYSPKPSDRPPFR